MRSPSISIVLLALMLLGNTAAAQTMMVTSFEAITAKAVKIEQLPESVAVILTEREPGTKTGAYLNVVSDRKWATPLYDGIEITETKTPGEFIMFAPAGSYRVLLSEFDPELGPRYSWHTVVVEPAAGEPEEPDDPDVPPPAGDFASLTQVAKEAADKLNDPPTRAALAKGYKAVIPLLEGKTYAEAMEVVQQTRRMVLIPAMRGNPAIWNDWLKAVDAELKKVVPVGDAAAYVQAIGAIVKGLE